MILQWNEQEIKKHCDYWRLGEINDIIGQFQDDFVEMVAKKLVIARDYKNILLRVVGKSMVTCSEILCLVTYGFPDGALSLARNLYEQSVALHFLELHRENDDFDEYVYDYFIDEDIQRLKGLLYDAQYYSQDKDEEERVKRNISILRKNAHHKGKNTFWWTGVSTLKDVAHKNMENTSNPIFSKYLAELHLVYMRSCLSLHANGYGNYLRLWVDNVNGEVNTAPQTNGHEISLYLAISSLIIIIGATCLEFNMDYTAYKNELNDLLLFYRKAMGSEYAHA